MWSRRILLAHVAKMPIQNAFLYSSINAINIYNTNSAILRYTVQIIYVMHHIIMVVTVYFIYITNLFRHIKKIIINENKLSYQQKNVLYYLYNFYNCEFRTK